MLGTYKMFGTTINAYKMLVEIFEVSEHSGDIDARHSNVSWRGEKKL
jgi:hypothetical protein